MERSVYEIIKTSSFGIPAYAGIRANLIKLFPKVSRILTLIISFAIAILIQNCIPIIEPEPLEDVEVTLSTDKTEYQPGEEVRMILTLRNLSSSSIVLNFEDGQIYDFVVRKLPEKTEIWRWSADKAFTTALWSMNLQQGYERSFSETWDQSGINMAKVEPGLYKIEANISSQPEIFAEPVQIRILSQAFETIEYGFFSAHAERASYVIKEREEWIKLWDKHARNIVPMPLPPEVDFSNFMVLAVFRGQFNTGGYSTEITKIAKLSDKIRVTVVESDGGPGMVLDVLTQPYHIVKTKKSDLPVEFAYIHAER